MYALPIFIKRYKSKINADCFVQNIRQNTMYIYDRDGYIKQSNPRGLICRNEKDKTIILKDQPCYPRYCGGVTAIMISNSKNEGEILITTIAYHDLVGTLWFVIAACAVIYGFIVGSNPFFLVFFIAFVFLMNSMDRKDLIRQKEFIDKSISDCQDNKL
jgi:hypothetical protein